MGAFAVRREFQTDFAVGVAILRRIVQKPRHQPFQRVAVAHNVHVRRDFRDEAQPLLEAHRVETEAGAFRQFAEIGVGEIDDGVLHLRELKHVDDEPVHTLYLRVNGVHPFGVFFNGGVRLRLHHREVGGDDGERGFELVRRVRDEVALFLKDSSTGASAYDE